MIFISLNGWLLSNSFNNCSLILYRLISERTHCIFRDISEMRYHYTSITAESNSLNLIFYYCSCNHLTPVLMPPDKLYACISMKKSRESDAQWRRMSFDVVEIVTRHLFVILTWRHSNFLKPLLNNYRREKIPLPLTHAWYECFL